MTVVQPLSLRHSSGVRGSSGEHQQTDPHLRGAYRCAGPFPLELHRAVPSSWFLPAGIPWISAYGRHMWSAYHVPSALGICVDAFTGSPQWLQKRRRTGDETRPREGDLVTLLPIAN